MLCYRDGTLWIRSMRGSSTGRATWKGREGIVGAAAEVDLPRTARASGERLEHDDEGRLPLDAAEASTKVVYAKDMR